MKKLYNNATTGLKSTILGILIFISSMSYLFVPMVLEATHPEFKYDVNMWYLVAGIITSLALVLIPDSIIAGLKKLIRKHTAIVLLLMVPLASSCVTFDKCQAKFGTMTSDSVYVHLIDTVSEVVAVIVPGDSLMNRFQLDSLLSAKVTDTLYLESESGRAKIKFWKDRYNNYLNFKLDIPTDTIRDTLTVFIDRKVPCPPIAVFEDRDPWIVRKAKPYLLPIGLVLMFLAAIFFIKRL